MKVIKNYLSKLGWSDISTFGKNKLINRSYVYLFLVPMIANFISKINSPLKLEIFEKQFEFVFTLPFSWIFFFFSALCFTIGSIIYNVCSPKIIMDNNSLGDFLNEKKSFSHLDSYLENLGIDNSWFEKYNIDKKKLDDLTFRNERQIQKHFGEQFSKRDILKVKLYNSYLRNLMGFNKFYSTTTSTDIDSIELQKPIIDQETYLAWSFWSIYEFANKSYYLVKLISFIFFVAGFILISIVLFQSIFTVIKLI